MGSLKVPNWEFNLASEPVAICDRFPETPRPTLSLPYAFTEHGALMAANVLNSPRAVAMSVYVIRAFVKMREEVAANSAILRRLAEIDRGGNPYHRPFLGLGVWPDRGQNEVSSLLLAWWLWRWIKKASSAWRCWHRAGPTSTPAATPSAAGPSITS